MTNTHTDQSAEVSTDENEEHEFYAWLTMYSRLDDDNWYYVVVVRRGPGAYAEQEACFDVVLPQPKAPHAPALYRELADAGWRVLGNADPAQVISLVVPVERDGDEPDTED